MLLQVVHVGVTLQEPQELVDDALEVELLCRQEREALLEIKAHLIAEGTERTSPSTVAFQVSLCEDMAEQIQILLHIRPTIIIAYGAQRYTNYPPLIQPPCPSAPKCELFIVRNAFLPWRAYVPPIGKFMFLGWNMSFPTLESSTELPIQSSPSGGERKGNTESGR